MAKKSAIKQKPSKDAERHGFSGAIVFAITTLIISLISKFTSALSESANILLDLFGKIGYDLTILGILFGIIYSFIAGFIFCYAYALIYNKLPSKN